jgi:hypothetical protein
MAKEKRDLELQDDSRFSDPRSAVGLIQSRGNSGQEPFGYSGPGVYPTVEGDELMGRVAEARAKGIYEAHGRNANAIARMKLDPSYAYARAAGIQLPGDGMKGTSKSASLAGGQSDELIGGGRRSTRYRDAGAAMRGGGEAKSFSESAYAGPNINQTTKGGRIDTARDTRDIPGGMSAPNNPNNQTLDSIPVSPSGSTSPDQGAPPKPISDPTAPATPNSPQSPSKPPTVESSKGPRLTTRSEPQQQDKGTSRGSLADEDRRIAEINMRPEAKDPNASQEKRERAKMDYDKAVQAEAGKDPYAKYRTERGDTEVAQRTGEVQDRSRYGGDRVMGRELYNSGGKEMVGNKMQRQDGSTYFVGLPSENQNRADAFNSRTSGGPDGMIRGKTGVVAGDSPSVNPYGRDGAVIAGAGSSTPKAVAGAPTNPNEVNVNMISSNSKGFDADVAQYSAGSNNSGISSRGAQTGSLREDYIAKSATGQRPSESNDLATPPSIGRNDISPVGQPGQNYKGPSSDDLKKKTKESAKSNSRALPV